MGVSDPYMLWSSNPFTLVELGTVLALRAGARGQQACQPLGSRVRARRTIRANFLGARELARFLLFAHARGRAREGSSLAQALLLRAQVRATLPTGPQNTEHRLILSCQVPPPKFIFFNLFEALGLETVFYFGHFWPPTPNRAQG